MGGAGLRSDAAYGMETCWMMRRYLGDRATVCGARNGRAWRDLARDGSTCPGLQNCAGDNVGHAVTWRSSARNGMSCRAMMRNGDENRVTANVAGRGVDRRLMSQSWSARAMRSCRLGRLRMDRRSPGIPSRGCSASAQPIGFIAISTMISSVKTAHGGDHTCALHRQPQLQLGDILQLRHRCHGRNGPGGSAKAARVFVRTMNATTGQPV